MPLTVTSKNKAYYFSTTGNDSLNGSKQSPWETISKLNTLKLVAGDSILLEGGQIFTGSILIDSSKFGRDADPIVITSYGNGKAIINGANGPAISVNKSFYVSIKNVICKGAGRKDGNTTNGIYIDSCSFIYVENVDVSGFQKAGLSVLRSSHVNATRIYAHENGFAGISVSGENDKQNCSDIYIGYCAADNNPGDPTNFTNHSGNGIIAGFCKNVTIEYCTATNNGWDMPRIGNGPVGIWCFEADSVTIQHCISYKNKTSAGGEDGGGYDLDGGMTNSVIQYCLSYGNQGSAFGIFQYAGASAWHDNTIRFCISENDGNVSAAHANTYIWNGSHDSTQFKNLLFYNNTIYNNKGAVINYSIESDHTNFKFYNNIFVAYDELVTGKESLDVFLSNDWWSLQNGFNINGNHNFTNWALANNKEQLNGELKGINIKPVFKNAGNTGLTLADQLGNFDNYKLTNSPPLMPSGLDLQNLYNINTGTIDFNGHLVQRNFLGSSVY